MAKHIANHDHDKLEDGDNSDSEDEMRFITEDEDESEDDVRSIRSGTPSPDLEIQTLQRLHGLYWPPLYTSSPWRRAFGFSRKVAVFYQLDDFAGVWPQVTRCLRLTEFPDVGIKAELLIRAVQETPLHKLWIPFYLDDGFLVRGWKDVSTLTDFLEYADVAKVREQETAWSTMYESPEGKWINQEDFPEPPADFSEVPLNDQINGNSIMTIDKLNIPVNLDESQSGKDLENPSNPLTIPPVPQILNNNNSGMSLNTALYENFNGLPASLPITSEHSESLITKIIQPVQEKPAPFLKIPQTVGKQIPFLPRRLQTSADILSTVRASSLPCFIRNTVTTKIITNSVNMGEPLVSEPSLIEQEGEEQIVTVNECSAKIPNNDGSLLESLNIPIEKQNGDASTSCELKPRVYNLKAVFVNSVYDFWADYTVL